MLPLLLPLLPAPPLRIRQPPHGCRDMRHKHCELPVLDDDGQVKVDVQNITFTKVIF